MKAIGMSRRVSKALILIEIMLPLMAVYLFILGWGLYYNLCEKTPSVGEKFAIVVCYAPVALAMLAAVTILYHQRLKQLLQSNLALYLLTYFTVIMIVLAIAFYASKIVSGNAALTC